MRSSLLPAEKAEAVARGVFVRSDAENSLQVSGFLIETERMLTLFARADLRPLGLFLEARSKSAHPSCPSEHPSLQRGVRPKISTPTSPFPSQSSRSWARRSRRAASRPRPSRPQRLGVLP